MSSDSDCQTLLSDQYRDASNLNVRIALHQRFSVNPYGWFRWLFDRIGPALGADVLELGCGAASLWAENLARLPADCRITLSDFSPGMVAAAQQTLADAAGRFTFDLVDAQRIPYPAASFDAVIANHVLMFVPDPATALAESARVLRPGGRFFASAIGLAHLREVSELVARFDPSLAYPFAQVAQHFGLENGGALLARHFDDVTLDMYEDALLVSDAGLLAAYIRSALPAGALTQVRWQALLQHVAAEMTAAGGVYRVTKATGLLAARKT